LTQVAQKERLKEVLAQIKQYKKENIFDSYFADDGKYRREQYPKHMDFFASGATFDERAFIAANRVGKTVSGCYELVCHLTGKYPTWWKGRRFNYPISAWCASITPAQMKTSVQAILFGEKEKGTGLLPKKYYTNADGSYRTWNMTGVPNVVGTVEVQHFDKFGQPDGISRCEFKTYEQGADKLQGARVDVIMLDEEPKDHNIYSECITRTGGDTDCEEEELGRAVGIIYCTFTPLLGFSDTVLSFLPDGMLPPNGINPDKPWKKVINAGWDDVPHLSEEWKMKRLADYAVHERDARTKGIPTKGSGAIYPYPEDMFVIPPFQVPKYWPRSYALDVGYDHPTAVLWGALDPDSDILYIYSEHYLRQTEVAIHAAAIKSRGAWIPGVIDPSANHKRSEFETVAEMYMREGLTLYPANNAVEPGIAECQQRIATGRVKVFNTCTNFLAEYRIYRRDENGKIVKKKDDLIDAFRYLVMSGIQIGCIAPDPLSEFRRETISNNNYDPITGY
jgi:phage terminase large subunit-like protein